MEGIVPARFCRVPMGGPTPSEEYGREWWGRGTGGKGGKTAVGV